MYYWIKYHTGCQIDAFVADNQQDMITAMQAFVSMGYTIIGVERKNYK